jgi:YfiH family protein
MEPFQLVRDELLLITEWQKLFPKLTAGFTTKMGGLSKEPFHTFNLGLHVNDLEESVQQNRVKLSKKIGFPTAQWVCSEQVHGHHIKKVSRNEQGKGVFNYAEGIPSTDGFYTDEPNLLLTACYADCVPLFFFAPERNMIGVAHAGWRGTVKDIAGKMIKSWVEEEGIPPERILVAIGPSIQDCCYIVDDRVIKEVKNTFISTAALPYKEVSAGQYSLNLSMLNKQLLLRAGIFDMNILMTSLCTSCEDELFFSHRRDHGKTGRMMSFIGYKED